MFWGVIMSKKGEKARELFLQGYNCSQAVFGAYAQDLGIDLDTALKISSSFGGGLGRLREVCGAVSGMAMVIGMKYGYSDSQANQQKKELYQKVQKYANKFKEENGSYVCKELLGLGDTANESATPMQRTKEYYQKRPCADLVEYAASLLEEI